MNSQGKGCRLFESYLKVKNDVNISENSQKVSIGYFILNHKDKNLIYKKSQESPSFVAKHNEQEILNFIDTVDTKDKGICDYPIGFQIVTKQRRYILYASSRIIYNRWMENLKQYFKETTSNNRNVTPNRTQEKSNNYNLNTEFNMNSKSPFKTQDKANNFNFNSEFKENEKSPITSKTKLTGNNSNIKIDNGNYFSNNLYFSNNVNDKGVGFDDDLINALNDFDDCDVAKKNSFKVNLSTVNVASKFKKVSNNLSEDTFKNNITSSDKDIKNQDKAFNEKIDYDEDRNNYNEAPKSLNKVCVGLTHLNKEWDNDYREIKTLAKLNIKERPSYQKSDQLKNEISIITSKKSIGLNQSVVYESPIKENKYKKNIVLFDDPSLHIRQTVNEAYTVENLHYGIEDNLNKSIIETKAITSQTEIKRTNGFAAKKSKAEINEKKIDYGQLSSNKRIIDSGEGFWTFNITVPIKQDEMK